MSDPLSNTLQQHGGALRELARALVGPQHADDLVQSTALAALARPHAIRQPAAFLRHLLRVRAARHHRDRARRGRREAVHAAGQELVAAAPEHALAQRETVAMLHAALMAVPQPHLGALLLRYFEDLSPPAIAERLAVPLPTIKSRLQRGLELLREELQRRAPDEDWRQRLAIAFGFPVLEAASAAPAIPLSVLLLMKTLAACFAVAAVSAFTWMAWPRNDGSPATAVGAAVESAASSSAVASAPAEQEPVREAVGEAQRAAVPDGARLIGRVLGADQRPLVGAEIQVLSARALGPDLVIAGMEPEPSSQPRSENVTRVTTGEDGRFVCDGITVGEHEVRVLARHHVSLSAGNRSFANDAVVDLGDVVMPAGVLVRGRVLDREEQPVQGTLVRVQGIRAEVMKGILAFWSDTRTDAEGRFVLGPLARRQFTIVFDEEELLDSPELSLGSAADEVDMVWHVESAARHPHVRGQVVDAAGRGVAGAKVTAREVHQMFRAISGADGRFDVRRLSTKNQQPVRISCVCDGCDETVLAEPVAWGSSNITLSMQPLVSLQLRVVDSQGNPVTAFQDYCVRVTGDDGMRFHTQDAVTAPVRGAKDGVHVIHGLRRSRYDLHVEPVDFRLAGSGMQMLDLASGLRQLTVVLPASTERSVQLRFADGSPVVGARLELCRPTLGEVGRETYVVPLAEWRNYGTPTKALLLGTFETGPDGNLALPGPSSTPLVLRIAGPTCLPSVVPIEHLDGPEPLKILCQRAGALRVSVSSIDVLREIASLGTESYDEPPHVWVSRAGGERIPAREASLVAFDAAGVAMLGGIPDGTWVPHFQFATESIVMDPVTVSGGNTTSVTMDLDPWRPVTVRGRVSRNGAPASHQPAHLERRRGRQEQLADRWVSVTRQPVVLDADGAFTVRSLPGMFRLLLPKQRETEGSHDLLAVPSSIEVAPGASTDVAFVVTTGSCVVRFVDSQRRPVAGVEGAWLRRPDGYLIGYLPASDANGRVRLDDVETNTMSLIALPRRCGPVPAAFSRLYADHPDDPDIVEHTLLDLGPVTVRPGEPVEHTVVLPDSWSR